RSREPRERAPRITSTAVASPLSELASRPFSAESHPLSLSLCPEPFPVRAAVGSSLETHMSALWAEPRCSRGRFSLGSSGKHGGELGGSLGNIKLYLGPNSTSRSAWGGWG